ncbi:MAG: DUF4982 domain-containing protein [Streptococcaceae bacterium]|jgi:beta-galactosidase|nr:DUF4982 domain-containing protein [Streptococcaceae bacterium]
MKKQLFNKNWKFWEEKDSFALVWSIPENAQDIDLPHDAMIYEKPYAESPNGGNTGFRDGKNYSYAKYIDLTEADKDKKFILTFEGVYCNAFVYVNGILAGNNYYGYTGFCVPLNDYLNFGKSNEIRVQVRNGAMSNSRWYSGSGIYRDVYLLSGSALHIAAKGCLIKTLNLENRQAELEIKVPVQNEFPVSQEFELSVKIRNHEGEIVASDQRPYYLLAGESADLVTNLIIDEVDAWSAEHPYLYEVETCLLINGLERDDWTGTIGIRTLTVDSKNGFRVNGETVKFRGACIHHDSGLLGAATYRDVHLRQIEILKAAGFNALRMSHHPAAPSLLEACDELGMYVMDEAFDMWTHFKSDFDYSLVFKENWQRDIKAMIETDYNHPSVVMYSIGNEIPEIGTKHGSRLARQMNEKIKSTDDSRPTLSAINGVFAAGDHIMEIMAELAAEANMEFSGSVNDFMTMMATQMHRIVSHEKVSGIIELAAAATDIAGYNYMTPRYEKDAARFPNRVMVGSETYPPQIAQNWNIVCRTPAVIGDFTWTGWDYIGEAGVGIPAYKMGKGGFGAQYPAQLAYVGDIDITGFRRPASYYREIVFGLRKNPYIAVQNPHHFGEPLMKTPWVISDCVSSWTWKEVNDKHCVVEVYAPGDEVALFLNGQLIEKKAVGSEIPFVTYFELPFQPGTLKAVNYQNGQPIGETELTTGNFAAAKINVSVDYQAEELFYIVLSLEDGQGIVINDADQEIEIAALEGASLMGFGSADPKPLTNYTDVKAKTYNGRAQLIVKKDKKCSKLILISNGENFTFEF